MGLKLSPDVNLSLSLSLIHRRDVLNLLLLCLYLHGKCSYELHSLVPQVTAKTHHATYIVLNHPYSLHIPSSKISLFSRTTTPWNINRRVVSPITTFLTSSSLLLTPIFLSYPYKQNAVYFSYCSVKSDIHFNICDQKVSDIFKRQKIDKISFKILTSYQNLFFQTLTFGSSKCQNYYVPKQFLTICIAVYLVFFFLNHLLLNITLDHEWRLVVVQYRLYDKKC